MQNPRILRAILGAVPAGLAVAGCVHIVNLEGLQPLKDTSALPSYRLADPVSHTIAESDIFEFTVSSRAADAPLCEITISTVCDSTTLPCPATYPGNQPLALAGRRARTTAFVLETAVRASIELSTACGGSRQTLQTARLIGRDWSSVKSRLEAQWILSGTQLTVARLAQPERRFMPGDRVRITAEYQAGSGATGAQAFTFTNSESAVDPGGYLYIPPLFNPAAPPPHHQNYYEIGRAFAQQAAVARVRIPVWRQGEPYLSQPTSAQLERCLASRWGSDTDAWTAIPPQLKHEREQCRNLGIDATTFSGGDADNNFIRYRLEVQQGWTAVLWDGRRFDHPYVPGQSVIAGVARVVREAIGRDEFPDHAVYATIDPRPELGERPFYARIHGPTVLDNVLIAPGDVVQISTFRPTTTAEKP